MNIQQSKFEQSVMLQKWLAYNSHNDKRMYLCIIACPHCKRVHKVTFGGWSALKCTGCQGYFGRPGATT